MYLLCECRFLALLVDIGRGLCPLPLISSLKDKLTETLIVDVALITYLDREKNEYGH